MFYHGNKKYVPLPCINCARGRRKDYGQWICSQAGFRPRPISEVHNCKSLNEYREDKKRRLNGLKNKTKNLKL